MFLNTLYFFRIFNENYPASFGSCLSFMKFKVDLKLQGKTGRYSLIG